MTKQTQNLLGRIENIYASANQPLSNDQLYNALMQDGLLSEQDLHNSQPVGYENKKYNLAKRKIRWYQQTLKLAGVIEPTGKHGEWFYKDKNGVEKVQTNTVLLGFSTKLGLALIGWSENVFSRLDVPINLVLTSPPYPLTNPRQYGNVKESEYVDWLCKVLEPVIGCMHETGSLVLNISNDIFLRGSPARSLYQERLVIALNDRFGLQKMDMVPWSNPAKIPGPIEWASKKRVQLNSGWEPMYWFCLNPHKVKANNQNVLLPHSDKHLDFVRKGGVAQDVIKSDGAYKLKKGAFSKETAGKIPKNVLTMGSYDKDNRDCQQYARENGLMPHGATMPMRLSKFWIEFLTDEKDVVADPCSGSFSSCHQAELLNRCWIGVDNTKDYVVGGASRFVDFEGFEQFVH